MAVSRKYRILYTVIQDYLKFFISNLGYMSNTVVQKRNPGLGKYTKQIWHKSVWHKYLKLILSVWDI